MLQYSGQWDVSRVFCETPDHSFKAETHLHPLPDIFLLLPCLRLEDVVGCETAPTRRTRAALRDNDMPPQQNPVPRQPPGAE